MPKVLIGLCVMILCLLFVAFIIGTPANLDDVKAHASETWKSNGYAIDGYLGFQWGFTVSPVHGGAKVWYTLKRIPDNGILYKGFIIKWGDEYHIYYTKAIDAIQPND